MEEDEKSLDIVIDSYEIGDDDGDFTCQTSYLYVNGERIDSDGNHIKAVLEHLGYIVTVEYN